MKTRAEETDRWEKLQQQWEKLQKQQWEARRQAELKRGREIGARAVLQQAFDPDYVPNAGISREERARRDEYIRRMRAGRGEPDASA